MGGVKGNGNGTCKRIKMPIDGSNVQLGRKMKWQSERIAAT